MNAHAAVVTGARVTHDDDQACDLAAVRRETERDLLASLQAVGEVEETFALQTCHRVEAYVVTDRAADGRAALRDAGLGDEDATVMDHEESIRHLMRVAAGLESVVLGEDQIIGQVRDAYGVAAEAGSVGPVLGEAVPKAIRVGERARTETGINDGVVSLGSAAVELAEREVGVEDASATVVGIGEMGTVTTIAFDRADVGDLAVANRTFDRARTNVDVHDVDASVLSLEDLDDRLPETDVLVTATAASDPVVERDALADAGEVYCIDLGQPRDVEPGAGDLPTVTLRDLEDLDAVTERTRAQREEAADAVEAIIDEEFDRLVEQFKRSRADEVIAAMYEGADRIKHRELQTAVSELEAEGELTEAQRTVLESFADALVSQLLSAPTRALRDAAEDDDWSTIATAIRLFDPEFEDDGLPEAVRADGRSSREASTGESGE
ncbi:MAG: glutamyl-tRNA reductase [Halanaeroarchaeum sp.]